MDLQLVIQETPARVLSDVEYVHDVGGKSLTASRQRTLKFKVAAKVRLFRTLSVSDYLELR